MSVYAVSKVQLDNDGRVIAVLWGRVDTHMNQWAGPEVRALVADVVHAIHRGDQVFALFPSAHGHLPDRRFMTVAYDNGWETVALEGPPTFERSARHGPALNRCAGRSDAVSHRRSLRR